MQVVPVEIGKNGFQNRLPDSACVEQHFQIPDRLVEQFGRGLKIPIALYNPESASRLDPRLDRPNHRSSALITTCPPSIAALDSTGPSRISHNGLRGPFAAPRRTTFQLQSFCPLVDLVPVYTVARPSQQFRKVVVSQTASVPKSRLLRNPPLLDLHRIPAQSLKIFGSDLSASPTTNQIAIAFPSGESVAASNPPFNSSCFSPPPRLTDQTPLPYCQTNS